MLINGKQVNILILSELIIIVSLLFINLTYQSETYSLRSQVVRNDNHIAFLKECASEQKEEINRLTDKKRLEEIAKRIGLQKVKVKNI
mgnify:CR=1 FL=1